MSVRFLRRDGSPTKSIATGEPLVIEVGFRAVTRVSNANFTVAFYSIGGELMAGHSMALDNYPTQTLEGEGSVRVYFDRIAFLPGPLMVSVGIFDEDGLSPYDWHQQRYRLDIEPGEIATGLIHLAHHWEVRPQ